jgi:hypothetical protein
VGSEGDVLLAANQEDGGGRMGLATREREGRRRVQREREGEGPINVEREGFSHQKLGHP